MNNKIIADVSEHQGIIDFKVLKEKVDGVIIRCGYTGYGKLKTLKKDACFESNYEKAKEVGLPIGFYYYSCATTILEAEKETKFIDELLRDKEIDLGVWFDTEDNHDIKRYAPQSQFSIGKDALTNVAKHWLSSMQLMNYNVGIYASTNWLNNQLNMNQLKEYYVWVAEYNEKLSYKGDFDMWQYTSKGNGNEYGVSSKYIDLSYLYTFVENEEIIEEDEKMAFESSQENIVYNGVQVKVIRIKGDFRGTVAGNSWDSGNSVMLAKNMSDKNLEKQGYDEICTVNGGLSYPYQNKQYANGIERIQGITNQDWDTDYDENMAFGFKDDGSVIFDKQKNIKKHLSEYYGALTFAFGIMKNGEKCTWGQNCPQYKQISGRSILGQNGNEIIIASFYGVTGQSGLYGSQLFGLCQKLSMKTAGCLDGGGSVYLSYNHKILIPSSRKIKNTIKFMVKYEEEKKEEKEIETMVYIKVLKGTYLHNKKGAIATRKDEKSNYDTNYPVYIGEIFGITGEPVSIDGSPCYKIGYGSQKGRWMKFDSQDLKQGYFQLVTKP